MMTSNPIPMQRAYSPAQFGEFLGLAETTVTHLIRKGEIYARKAGRRWVIPDWVLEDYLARPEPKP